MISLPLLTDLYELTMAAAYYRHRMFGKATFSLFIRDYPPNRGYFVNAGLEDVKIVVSGGFDEHKIARVLERGAEIDAFGVGTKMGVSADGPYTDMAYKLVKYDGRPVLKLSSGKKTLVDEKQVFRQSEDGRPKRDIIALRQEESEGAPLLRPVMKGGTRLEGPEPVKTIRDRFQKDFDALDERYKRLEDPSLYPVALGPDLKKLQEKAVHQVVEKELGES